ncbi:hypothetical protein Asulf_01540 [Archaeoglobus sulfaticallidus PM70-1]|uniref:Uncharacterized protein n=1 Tax=Archaeoglobus sulfaticallidus PM70-1 TaxID=387631 RepID=N0BEV4_9EURY|nr:hypothetical protein [Archaeoglobus sulfaticallidus]AGK61518.1 hypothetical protein Asulf_01540 [Archaeoglobus sulfaticallidus PM70-1]
MELRLNAFDMSIPLSDWKVDLRLNEIGTARVKTSDEYLFLIKKAVNGTYEIIEDGITIFKGVLKRISRKFNGELEIELDHWIKKLDRKLFSKDGNYRVEYVDSDSDPVYSFTILNDVLNGETEFEQGYCAVKRLNIKGNFESKLEWIRKISENILWGYDSEGNIRIGDGYTIAMGSTDFWVDDENKINIAVRGLDATKRQFIPEIVCNLPNNTTDSGGIKLLNGYYWAVNSDSIKITIGEGTYSKTITFTDNGYQGTSATEELYKSIKFFFAPTEAENSYWAKIVSTSNGVLSNDAEACTPSTVWYKLKTITLPSDLPANSTLTISFDLKCVESIQGTTDTVYGKIYRNDVGVGTTQSTASTTYVTYTETIDGWNPGDLAQLYAKTSYTEVLACVSNFRILNVPFEQGCSLTTPEAVVGVFGRIDFYGYYDSTLNEHYTRVEVVFEEYLWGSFRFRTFDITDYIVDIVDFSIDYSKLINKVHVLGYGDEITQVYYTTEDIASQSSYFVSEGVHTDRKIRYDSEAQVLAEKIILQRKEPVKNLTVKIDSRLVKEKTVELGQFVRIDGLDEDIDGEYRVVEIRNFNTVDCELVLTNNLVMLSDFIKSLNNRVSDVVKYP